MPKRLEALKQWLQTDGLPELGTGDVSITPASSDASFRRYFRVVWTGGETSYIVMDAPPDKEGTEPFVRIARQLLDAGLQVPQVLAADIRQGFLLLSDLGDRPYLDVLDEHNVDHLYADALDALLILQRDVPCDSGLPFYDRALLLQEMELFRDWYLRRLCDVEADTGQYAVLDDIFHQLADAALSQPQVFVHRDYHSRNLMLTTAYNPGILDFQDAVIGPVTYDLVSLLRDCYVAWPRQRVEQWALDYLHRAAKAGIFPCAGVSDAQLLRWLDWMGIQRHLKAVGIFVRLWLRDGKPGYLDDIPRTLGYVCEVSARYPELSVLSRLLERLPPSRMGFLEK